MKLLLTRNEWSDKSTIGTLSVDGVPECYTLEDTDRGLVSTMDIDELKLIKVQNETCIPYGMYEIELYNSPKHKRILPRLIAVPGYSYVEIHPGNKPEDTDGCILVGDTNPVRPDWIEMSRSAYDRLFMKIDSAISRHEPVFIEIVKGVSNGIT